MGNIRVTINLRVLNTGCSLSNSQRSIFLLASLTLRVRKKHQPVQQLLSLRVSLLQQSLLSSNRTDTFALAPYPCLLIISKQLYSVLALAIYSSIASRTIALILPAPPRIRSFLGRWLFQGKNMAKLPAFNI